MRLLSGAEAFSHMENPGREGNSKDLVPIIHFRSSERMETTFRLRTSAALGRALRDRTLFLRVPFSSL